VIRLITREELPFAFSGWTRSARGGPAWPGLVEELATPLTVLVRQAEDDGLLDGFVCLEQPDIIHAVYTRPTARRQGIANSLILSALEAMGLRPTAPVRYTWKVREAWLRAKVPRHWTFCPRLLMRGNHGQDKRRIA
jgi:ribosomal protein S18 acetylase RimI-like enzyme